MGKPVFHNVTVRIPIAAANALLSSQIAVMGDQSSGKSSVLEAISGIPFPRGTGLVTRCAIRLAIKSAPAGSPWRAQATLAGEMASAARIASSPDELTALMKELMEAVTDARGQSFSGETIKVELSAPGAPDIILVDLPGIIRTSAGGSDAVASEQIDNAMATLLCQEQTIILAVLAANQDIMNADILRRAAQVVYSLGSHECTRAPVFSRHRPPRMVHPVDARCDGDTGRPEGRSHDWRADQGTRGDQGSSARLVRLDAGDRPTLTNQSLARDC